MKDYRKVKVWDKAHILTKDLYRVTSKFPKDELFGLTSQLRRAGSSIPTNIAEGCGRGSDADFRRFLQIAFGSANEVEYIIFLSYELNYIQNDQFIDLNNKIIEVKKMLAGMIKTLTNDIINSKKADRRPLTADR